VFKLINAVLDFTMIAFVEGAEVENQESSHVTIAELERILANA
jgi:hypothetical protein